ncbi:UNVERIFIED_CONTAM: Retrovirus-related Pol polyprotein from transposon TNT 1-94 [Sesamum calycinum]|uniref:Retrovirus-related Pol polyprotein from transposon TNT 1-94 n=1 Tax=Sesamum calycinum TaxID=2727403 RepID=A0AAW2N3I5_9LAMI
MGRKLLNTAPSKTVLQTPYKIWHGKPASYKYLTVWSSPAYVKKLVGDKLDSRSSLCRFVGYPKETVGYYFYDPPAQKIFVSRNAMFLKKKFPTESRCDEMLLEESTETPQQNDATSFEPLVPTDGVSFLRRSIKESRPPERPVGCKWVYKYKLGADEEVTAFKARLVAKGYTQRPGVDFEETYSHVAIAKSMRILFANSIMATTADSTTEAEYIAALEVAKEVVWMKNYIQWLGMVSSIAEPVVVLCNNNRAILQAKKPRSHHHSKYILRLYHLLGDMVSRCDVRIDRVTLAEITADPLTNPMSQIAHTQHLDKMELRLMGDWL